MSTPAAPAFHQIAYGSTAYDAECRLRDEVLRQPLGLSLYDENLAAEATQLHFGLFAADMLLACIIASPLSETGVKLRQMAVAPGHQGRGYGRRLLELLETELVDRGYATATLSARTSALAFYVRLGFEAVGDEFTEVGIPHHVMVKRLGGRSDLPRPAARTDDHRYPPQ